MAGFEDLIRGALLKQGAPNAANRQKVYESAHQALERMLESNDAMTPEIGAAQREKLKAAIVEIEGSYGPDEAPASPPPAPPTPAPTPPIPAPNTEREETPSPAATTAPPIPRAEPTPRVDPIPRVTPADSPTRQDAVNTDSVNRGPPPLSVPKPARREPAFDNGANTPPVAASAPGGQSVHSAQARSSLSGEPAAAREYQGDVLNERKPYAKLLLWTIILVGLGVAIWWAITFGPGLLREQFDGSVRSQQPTLESGAFVPGDGNQDGWVTVFMPDINAADVVTNGAGAAELQNDGARSIMRMASPDRETQSNLLIRVPRGVMKDLQGQAATLELVLKSSSADSQEFVIYCQFEAMGNCGRKRFTMTSNPEPFIFDILVNDTFLKESEDAYLAINTDFSGQGRALDLYSIRVRTGS